MKPPPSYEPGTIRDRLANERTLLAWVRTALALMAFGVAVEKFAVFVRFSAGSADHVQHLPDPALSEIVGIALVVIGGLLAVVGGWRTRVFAEVIDPRHRAPRDLPLALTAGLTILLAILLVAYLALG